MPPLSSDWFLYSKNYNQGTGSIMWYTRYIDLFIGVNLCNVFYDCVNYFFASSFSVNVIQFTDYTLLTMYVEFVFFFYID